MAIKQTTNHVKDEASQGQSQKLRFLKASDLPEQCRKPFSCPLRVSVTRFVDPEEMPSDMEIWADWLLAVKPVHDPRRGFTMEKWPDGSEELLIGVKQNSATHEIVAEFGGDNWKEMIMEGVMLWVGSFPGTGESRHPKVWPVRPEGRWKDRFDEYVGSVRDLQPCQNTSSAAAIEPTTSQEPTPESSKNRKRK